MGTRLTSKQKERGASLVEFAFVAPLLVMLLFGMIEFGWLFSQNLDVRHGAREGARLAAVNFPEGPPPNSGARSNANAQALAAEVCDRMQTATGAAITVASAGSVGDEATVTVDAPGDTLTGMFDWALPSGFELSSSVSIRLEQDATWADIADEAC